MVEVLAYFKNHLADNFAIYFIPLYIVGGRPGAILSAQLLGFKSYFLLPVVVVLDTLQIPFFYHLYDSISSRLPIKKIGQRFQRKGIHLQQSKFFLRLQLLGPPGVLTVTMLPIKGCGMWSGVLLSRLLKLPKQISYPLMIFGSLLGCVLLLEKPS